MSAVTQHGYLLLADISGYTSFVAETELEHSHEILSDLLGTICEKIEALLTISKLEGDAVFAYAPEATIQRGETLLELIEATYLAFRDRQTSIKRATTCTCNACRNIPSLDLKFIAHHGDYVVQRVRDIRELVGSDVNLIHRLLKNHIAETTGWRAYAMLTEQCLDHLKLNLEAAYALVEEYEHLGQVRTYNLDLHQRYREITEERRIMIDEKDADLIVRVDFSTPPPVTWEWLQDPIKRNLWTEGIHWTVGDRPRGRAGRGASNHCAHGKSVSTETTLDWRPFEYSTVDSYENGKKTMSETIRFEPLPDGGTRVHDFMQVHMPLPRFLRQIIARVVLIHQMKYDQFVAKAARLAGEEYNRSRESNES
ncbi:MAG: DUF2652 domain-containing protein [Anaerolineales bacterium]|nr:DUF2652 domain-containing protein [Anaerolineales bacterium]NUQ85880.1 DUF2652 domain-containing protein [Anaerolineales bacterium]